MVAACRTKTLLDRVGITALDRGNARRVGAVALGLAAAGSAVK